jgi:hypothetical protein
VPPARRRRAVRNRRSRRQAWRPHRGNPSRCSTAVGWTQIVRIFRST